MSTIIALASTVRGEWTLRAVSCNRLTLTSASRAEYLEALDTLNHFWS